MADFDTNIPQVSQAQAQHDVVVNSLVDAGSPGMIFGKNFETTAALTWGYIGGKAPVDGEPTDVPNGTIALTASSTNYVYAEQTASPVHWQVVVTTSEPSLWPGPLTGTKIALYTIVTGATTVTSYTDHRIAGLFASVAVSLVDDSVSNDILAEMAAKTFKGNNTASTANPVDMTVAQAQALLAVQRQHTYTYAGSIAVETDLYDIVDITLTGPLTLTFSGGIDGKSTRVRLRQDGSGSHLLTLGAGVRVGADIATVTLSTAASKLDYLAVVYNSTDSKYDVIAFNKGF